MDPEKAEKLVRETMDRVVREEGQRGRVITDGARRVAEAEVLAKVLSPDFEDRVYGPAIDEWVMNEMRQPVVEGKTVPLNQKFFDDGSPGSPRSSRRGST